MPHKHTRRTTLASSYDLPPTSLARPLSTYKPKILKSTPKVSSRPQTTPKPSSTAYTLDDTPRAFTRLISYCPPPRAGLDDGHEPKSRKRKRSAVSEAKPETTVKKPVVAAGSAPRILPGESMSSFSARVDAALPVAGLTAKGKKAGAGIDRGRQTKTERKMQRMQKEWREEERRLKEKREEAQEEEMDKEDDYDALVAGWTTGKKGGKRKGHGNDLDEEEDPWAHIAAKPVLHDEQKTQATGGLVGLHDVVLAPPKFVRPPREKIIRIGGKNNVGVGLKRQAELGEARKQVVENYRAMVKEKGREAS